MPDFKIVKVIHTSTKNKQETAQITYKGDYKNAPVKTKHVRRPNSGSHWRDEQGNTYA